MIRTNASISAIRTFSSKRGNCLISAQAIQKVRDFIFTPKDVFEKVLAEESLADNMAKVINKNLFSQPVEADSLTTISPDEADTSLPLAKSILIVDDDEDIQKLVSRFLQSEGYTVSTSADGIEALLMLGKKKFDLILSDINMPNLDGFKLVEMLNQKGIAVPVVFITSRLEVKDEERGLKLGAVDYIKKPIKKDLLLLRIQKVLGGKV